MYANKEEVQVTMNTPMSSIFFGCFPTEIMETALITNRLNEAEPTIVEGPSSPGMSPSIEIVSMQDKRISGALEPSAIKLRLAMVGFHTKVWMLITSMVSGSVY